MLIVRSPVRISFGGGGTDLPSYFETHGGAVLSATINKHFYTVLQRRSDGRVQVISSDLRANETWDDIGRLEVKGSDLEIPLSVLKRLNRAISASLFLASEIPPGTGLGSSASVCVNVLKTLTAYLHIPLSKYELAETAYEIARNELGKPVGKQDEYAAAFGGLNYISFFKDGSVTVAPVELDRGVLDELQDNLMLFFTGSAHHSWTILRDQEQSTRSSTGLPLESLHEIHALAREMRQALVAGELDAFGSLLDRAWEAKKRVSSKISTPRIDQLYSAARAVGALGGKITGAGGGGFLLLYCPRETHARVRQAMSEFGVHEMAFEFDFQGAQVIVNDPFVDGDDRSGEHWRFLRVADVPLSTSMKSGFAG